MFFLNNDVWLQHEYDLFTKICTSISPRYFFHEGRRKMAIIIILASFSGYYVVLRRTRQSRVELSHKSWLVML